jgi:predicted ferric reductase
MNYEAVKRLDRHERNRATGSRAVRSQAETIDVQPPVTGRRMARTATRWVLGMVFYGLGEVIVWLWLNGGGITGVHDWGTLFTSAGRLTGLVGAYLLLVQVVLLARVPVLEWIAGFDRLTVWHRINGRLCLTLILTHVGLITAGYALTDRLSIPAEFSMLLSSYPGMLAALVGTVLLVLVVLTSVVIVRRRLRYETWFLVHLLTYAGVLLGWFHQLPTGNEFITNPLAAAFWTGLYVATLQLVILGRFAQPVVRALWHQLRVAEVIEEAPGVVSLRITGRHLEWPNARAGQFFLWRFLTPGRWWEAHPFSLSAAPDGRSLRITVKDLGDFSARVGAIKPGTFVVAEGPFGSFTDDVRTRDRAALIAGGIGITPIRALIEEMKGDLVLIYRAVRAEELIFRDELDRIARQRGITVHYLLGDHRTPGNERLLSAEHLRQLVPTIASREIYLCGPPAMMRAVRQSIDRLGIPTQYVHTDEFAL